jgi:hypothetical protein
LSKDYTHLNIKNCSLKDPLNGSHLALGLAVNGDAQEGRLVAEIESGIVLGQKKHVGQKQRRPMSFP